MFTTVAYSKAQDYGVEGLITPVADPHVRVEADNVIVPVLKFIAGHLLQGEYVTRGRIESPSLRGLVNPDIEVLDRAAKPSDPSKYHDNATMPIELVESEALNIRMKNDYTTLTIRQNAIVLLSDGPITPVTGKITTVRAESTSLALTAYTWTNGALTFSQTLPAGTYQIVGMRAKATNLVAARCVIPGYVWRPGCVAVQAVSHIGHSAFRHGRLGVWGSFPHTQPPTIDFLNTATETVTPEVFLDLIKVA